MCIYTNQPYLSKKRACEIYLNLLPWLVVLILCIRCFCSLEASIAALNKFLDIIFNVWSPNVSASKSCNTRTCKYFGITTRVAPLRCSKVMSFSPEGNFFDGNMHAHSHQHMTSKAISCVARSSI